MPTKTRINVRQKGANAERDIIKLLQPALERVYQQLAADYPHLADLVGTAPRLQRNALQADGGGSDIAGLEWLALEVKCQETLAVPAWWRQCTEQAGKRQTPVLAYRRNGAPWRIRMQVRMDVVRYRPAWEPIVEMSWDAFVAYFSMRSYDELGHKVSDIARREGRLPKGI